MNIYLHELRSNWKRNLYYLGGMLLLTSVFLSFHSIFTSDTADMIKMLQGFPKVVQNTFGFDLINIFSTLGYYAFILFYIMLITSIQSMNMGVSILSKEERDKTADFLMTKPASRTKILVSKYCAALTIIIVCNITYFIGSYSGLKIIADAQIDFKKFVLLNLTVFIVQFIFLAIGFLIGVFLKRIKNTISITLAVVFGFFAIGAFAVNSSSDKMRYLSPFKYFDNAYILKNGSYELSYLIVGLVLVIVCLATSYLFYVKKDIDSV